MTGGPSLPGQDLGRARGLPQPLRNAAHRAIFHLLQDPVLTPADPFPEDDPLPGAFRPYLPSDGLTISYTVTESQPGKA